MVHIAHLVLPCSEASSRIHALRFEERIDHGKRFIPAHGRHGIGIRDIYHVSADDPLSFAFGEHAGVYQSLDGCFNDLRAVNRFVRRVRSLAHEREKAAGIAIRDVPWRIVVKVGYPVEGAIVLGEIHPALAVPPFPLDTDADDEAAVVDQATGSLAHGLGNVPAEAYENVERNGGNEGVVPFAPTVGKAEFAGSKVNLRQFMGERDAILETSGDAAENRPCTTLVREFEGIVRPPVHVISLLSYVLLNAGQIDDAYPFADPLARHFVGGDAPYLFVVGLHEMLDDAGPEDTVHPFTEVGCKARRSGQRLKASQALFKGIRREVTDIVLERVWNPCFADADPALPLVLIPGAVKGLLHHTVKIVVVGEEDVTADVPGEAMVVDVGGGEAADLLGGLEEMPILQPESTKTMSRTKAGGTSTYNEDARHWLSLDFARGDKDTFHAQQMSTFPISVLLCST